MLFCVNAWFNFLHQEWMFQNSLWFLALETGEIIKKFINISLHELIVLIINFSDFLLKAYSGESAWGIINFWLRPCFLLEFYIKFVHKLRPLKN